MPLKFTPRKNIYILNIPKNILLFSMPNKDFVLPYGINNQLQWIGLYETYITSVQKLLIRSKLDLLSHILCTNSIICLLQAYIGISCLYHGGNNPQKGLWFVYAYTEPHSVYSKKLSCCNFEICRKIEFMFSITISNIDVEIRLISLNINQ